MEWLRSFLDPHSVALVGASEKEKSAGRTLLDNLLLAKDQRRIYAVNPVREKVLDIKCYPTLDSLPETPDLAVIATKAGLVADIVENGGKAGIKSMVIVSSGFRESGKDGEARERAIRDAARRHGIRVIGPNCLGLMRPVSMLNATFATRMTKSGHIAFLSQSGALGAAVLDWAFSRDIGLSAFVSLGNMVDVDFGDLIDYLGTDPLTRSIIIYLESFGDSLSNARKFISAARGFASTKPIIILKPGKYQESARAAQSHTGALVGEDLYYDAAFDRAGTVRVEEIEDLFNCASILNTARLPHERNLAIITNAGGPAGLATDSLISRGGRLAELSQDTLSRLNQHLPPFWSRSNPIDILEDADEHRYEGTIRITLEDPGVSGVVIIYTPQGAADPAKLAGAIIKCAEESDKPVLTVMMGSGEVTKARQMFYDSNIPTYNFPEKAVRTYLYMCQYAVGMEELYETPQDLPLGIGPPRNYLKVLTRKAIKEGRLVLSEEDSKKLLKTYGITSTQPHLAISAEEAVSLAATIGYPVAMKVSSPDVSHKSDVGGVALNVSSPEEVKRTFATILANVARNRNGARVDGITLQKMLNGYDYELILGSTKGPILGTVIVFGRGGAEAEFFKDIAVGLPPLNQKLARKIMEKTKFYRLLSQGFRTRPPANLRLLDETLVKVSNLVIDFPEIKELDINPLVITGDLATALDARVVLDAEAPKADTGDHPHLIISPYPTKYTQPWKCSDGRTVSLRPIRPEDEPLEEGLLAGLSPESARFRFFHIIKEVTHEMLSRLCNIDYDREMAIIAEFTASGKSRNVGVGRLIVVPGQTGEFAVVVADDFQNQGLGLKLSDMLIGIAQEKGLTSIYALVLNENVKMLKLARKLGFTIEKVSDEESKLTLEL